MYLSLKFPPPIISQNEAFDQSFFLAGADKPAHGLAGLLGCAPFFIRRGISIYEDTLAIWRFFPEAFG